MHFVLVGAAIRIQINFTAGFRIFITQHSLIQFVYLLGIEKLELFNRR